MWLHAPKPQALIGRWRPSAVERMPWWRWGSEVEAGPSRTKDHDGKPLDFDGDDHSVLGKARPSARVQARSLDR